jgi:hypothetical protein
MRNALRILALSLTLTCPVTAQISVKVAPPTVPGTRVAPTGCPAFDSLNLGKYSRKVALFRAMLPGDSVLLTTEPFTSDNVEKWAFHYFWISAKLPPGSLGQPPADIQVNLWAWSAPILTTATPPGTHFIVALDKKESTDLGELKLDPARSLIRFSEPTQYPAKGQTVFTHSSPEAVLRVAKDRKARAALPEGSFIFSGEQRGGIALLFMGALCGVQ